MNKKNDSLWSLLSIVMLFMLGWFFVSCGGSDEDESITDNPSVFGTWSHNENEKDNSELTFNTDGTILEFTQGKNSKTQWEGRFSLKNNRLTIYWQTYQRYSTSTNSWSEKKSEDEKVVITVSLSDNTLTFVSMEGETTYQPVVYSRKK